MPSAPPSRHILFPYTGNSIGGSHMSSLLLARALRDAGHRITIGLHQPDGPLAALIETHDFTWQTLPDVPAPRLRAPWRQVWPRYRARRVLGPVLAQKGIDIVHSHDMRNHLLWGAATDGGNGTPQVPHVWHQRTPASGRHMTPWGRRAAAFISVSEFTRSSLPADLRPHSQMIYNPFLPQDPATPEARAALRRAIGVPQNTDVIGYISNFSDRKRPVAFVEIAARLHKRQTSRPMAFVMFGAPNEPWLSQVTSCTAEHGLTEHLHILGLKTPFAPWMAGLSVLIAPARHEALGRTMIEAGFAGVPVVATNEGGTPEIILDQETGHLVEAEDLDGFANAALDVLQNPAATLRRVEAARLRVENRFSLKAHLEAILSVYNRCCAHPS